MHLTLLSGLMTGITAATISEFGINQGQEATFDSAGREAESKLKDPAPAQISSRNTDECVNTWSATAADELRNANEFSDTWVESPLFRIVENPWDWPSSVASSPTQRTNYTHHLHRPMPSAGHASNRKRGDEYREALSGTLARNGTARALRVRLTAQPVGKRVVIKIANKGPGFGESVLRFAFDPSPRTLSDLPLPSDSLGASQTERGRHP